LPYLARGPSGGGTSTEVVMQDLVAPTNEELKGYADKWWLVLILGIVWIIFAWIVLSFDFNTVLAIAVFAGVSFIFAGISEFFYAAMVEEWKWLWIALGVISVIAGIVALVWPGQTFLVLAAIVGWYLMFRGLFDLITAIMTKDENDMWWFGLVAGILQIGIGFWAIGYEGRSIALLVVWIGAYALVKGIMDIVLAFKLRSAGKHLGKVTPAV
jgi:uncharacterized membrane protein HdeD (DUF308 family)